MAVTLKAFTLAGSSMSICAALPATLTKTAYAALTWSLIGEVDDFGAVGRVYNTVKFTPVASRGTRKLKGSFDEGTQNIKVGYASGDPGQIIVDAALSDDNFYSFKAVLKDGTILYYEAQVSSAPIEMGTIDNIVMRSIALELNSGTLVIVPAT